jgi:hypothetical protein
MTDPQKWLALGAVLLLHSFVASQMALIRACLPPEPRHGDLWTWAAINGLGFPVLLPLLGAYIFKIYCLAEDSRPFDFAVVTLGIVWPLAFCTTSLAIAHSEKKLPLGSPIVAGHKERNRARALALLGFLAMLVFDVALGVKILK